MGQNGLFWAFGRILKKLKKRLDNKFGVLKIPKEQAFRVGMQSESKTVRWGNPFPEFGNSGDDNFGTSPKRTTFTSPVATSSSSCLKLDDDEAIVKHVMVESMGTLPVDEENRRRLAIGEVVSRESAARSGVHMHVVAGEEELKHSDVSRNNVREKRMKEFIYPCEQDFETDYKTGGKKVFKCTSKASKKGGLCPVHKRMLRTIRATVFGAFDGNLVCKRVLGDVGEEIERLKASVNVKVLNDARSAVAGKYANGDVEVERAKANAARAMADAEKAKVEQERLRLERAKVTGGKQVSITNNVYHNSGPTTFDNRVQTVNVVRGSDEDMRMMREILLKKKREAELAIK